MYLWAVYASGRFIANVREDFARRIEAWAIKHNLDVVVKQTYYKER